MDASVYVLPSLVNAKNRLYSIAELISFGYASFFRDGDTPMTNFDMTRFFQFSRLDEPGVPRFRSSSGDFDGGMRTNYGSFRSDDDLRAKKKDRPYQSNENPSSPALIALFSRSVNDSSTDDSRYR